MGAKIDQAPSTTVVLSWLSTAGTSQEVWRIDLTPRPSTTDVSFAYNTPTPFVTHHSSSSSNFQMNFARSRLLRYRWPAQLFAPRPRAKGISHPPVPTRAMIDTPYFLRAITGTSVLSPVLSPCYNPGMRGNLYIFLVMKPDRGCMEIFWFY